MKQREEASGDRYRTGVFECTVVLAGLCSDRAAAQGSNLLWSADHEEGQLSDWYVNNGGGEFNSGNALSTASTDVAHRGRYSVKATISAPPISGVRLFRWAESLAHQKAYYSAWYLLPQNLSGTLVEYFSDSSRVRVQHSIGSLLVCAGRQSTEWHHVPVPHMVAAALVGPGRRRASLGRVRRSELSADCQRLAGWPVGPSRSVSPPVRRFRRSNHRLAGRRRDSESKRCQDPLSRCRKRMVTSATTPKRFRRARQPSTWMTRSSARRASEPAR